MRLSRLSLSLIIGLLPAALAGACYGPTEATVELTTNRACDDGLRTAIYRGDYRSSSRSAAAVVEGCPASTPGAGASGVTAIGSMVFVPSASRDAEVALTVAMRVDGKSPDACWTNGVVDDACIVATRSFKYVEHASLRIPILLDDACRGVTCAEGETCTEGGACVDHHARCDSGRCSIPAEEPGALLDAASDAGGDVHPSDPDAASDGGGSCPTGSLATENGLPLHAAAANGTFYYVVKDYPDQLWIVTPGKSRRMLEPGGEISALAARRSTWVVGFRRGVGETDGDFIKGESKGQALEQPTGQVRMDAIAIAPDEKVVFTSRDGSVDCHTITGPPDNDDCAGWSSACAPPIGAGMNVVYCRDTMVSEGDPGPRFVGRSLYGTGIPPSIDPPLWTNTTPSQNGIIASTDAPEPAVYAAGVGGTTQQSRERRIQLLEPIDGLAPWIAVTVGEVSSLAVDESYVYATIIAGGLSQLSTIYRWRRSNAEPAGQLLIADATEVQHVTAHEGCVYYWATVNGSAVLRAAKFSVD